MLAGALEILSKLRPEKSLSLRLIFDFYVVN